MPALSIRFALKLMSLKKMNLVSGGAGELHRHRSCAQGLIPLPWGKRQRATRPLGVSCAGFAHRCNTQGMKKLRLSAVGVSALFMLQNLWFRQCKASVYPSGQFSLDVTDEQQVNISKSTFFSFVKAIAQAGESLTSQLSYTPKINLFFPPSLQSTKHSACNPPLSASAGLMPQTFLFIFAAEVTCRHEHRFKNQLLHVVVCNNRAEPSHFQPFCLTGSPREWAGGRGAPAVPSVLSLL